MCNITQKDRKSSDKLRDRRIRNWIQRGLDMKCREIGVENIGEEVDHERLGMKL